MTTSRRSTMKRLTKRDPARESGQLQPSPLQKTWKNGPISPGEAESLLHCVRSPADPRSSIRGRISGPIPISTPLDDDFPMGSPAYAIGSPGFAFATPTGFRHQVTGVEPGASNRDHQFTVTPVVLERDFGIPPPEDTNTSNEQRDTFHTRSHSGPISPAPRDSQTQKRNQNRAARQSTFSIGSSGDREKPPPKRSTLRGAIVKLFGRRRKNTSQDSLRGRKSGPKSDRPSAQHQRSATIDVITVGSQHDGGHKRSASLHPDYGSPDFGKALRSHNVGPEDRLAIESARSSIQSFSRRRMVGASIQSVRRHQTRESEPSGLTPRPASIHGRILKDQPVSDDPEEIGKAITSDFSGLKRRSQSLSAIAVTAAMATNADCGRRSRSGEIRYWRQSYDPGYREPCDPPHGVETEVNSDGNAKKTEPLEERSPTPPQPFSFGDMASMNQMAGMKITQAANIETRLVTLEKRTRRLEKVVTEMRNAKSDFRPPPDAHDRNRANTPPVSYRPSTAHSNWSSQQWYDASTKQISRPSTRHSHTSSKSSFDQAPANEGTTILLPPRRSNPNFSPHNRSSTAATIRGTTSLPALSQELSPEITADQYATLMALIETERSSRQVLEAHVKTLGHQVNVMSRAMNGCGPSKSSFSVQSTQSAFDYDDDEEDAAPAKLRGQGLAAQDSGFVASTHEEDECYITPTEEEEDDDSYLAAPHQKPSRTLSLSQMTMNRPRQPREPMPGRD